LSAKSGLDPEQLKTLFAGVLTLKKPSLDRYFFPDGKGGLCEEPARDIEDPFQDSMVKAFEYFKLDPEDPSSWRLLVSCFAYIFFWQPPRRPTGAQKKWTKEREDALCRALEGLPGLSDIRAAMRLANDKRSPFYVQGTSASDGVSGLRRRIAKVRKKPSGEVGT
jgi:hypothetical protein